MVITGDDAQTQEEAMACRHFAMARRACVGLTIVAVHGLGMICEIANEVVLLKYNSVLVRIKPSGLAAGPAAGLG